jgi:hypothetical protein
VISTSSWAPTRRARMAVTYLPKNTSSGLGHYLSGLAHFLEERNAKKKAAREQRRSAKGASSGRAAGSST